MIEHRNHIKQELKHLLIKSYKKTQSSSVILTQHAFKIIFSFLTESEIYACGLSKYVCSKDINPYYTYDYVIMIITPNCLTQVQQITQTINTAYIINLNFSNTINCGLKRLKQLQFKGDGIKGIVQQNIDFHAYIDNVYLLEHDSEYKNGRYKQLRDQNLMCDRLCSFLCSFPKFYEFCISYTKNDEKIAESIQSNLSQRFKLLHKYSHSSYTQSSSPINLVIFSRTQNISPFLHNLTYGPLLEELKLVQTTKCLSIHSQIFNYIYCKDIKSAAQLLQKYAYDFSKSKRQGITFNKFQQVKKDLLQAYNPSITAQQLRVHQECLKQMHKFLDKNKKLIILQQNIANGIDNQGIKVKGGKVIDKIIKWADGDPTEDQKKQGKLKKQQQVAYEYYLLLVLISLETNSFWWYQRNQLISGLQQKHKSAMKQFIKKSQKKNLCQSKPQLDQDGRQTRTLFFRHQSELANNIVRYLQGEMSAYKQIRINHDEQNLKLKKQSKTILYINDIVGYNQLAQIKKKVSQFYQKQNKVIENDSGKLPNNIEILCKGCMKTSQWVNYRLQQCSQSSK